MEIFAPHNLPGVGMGTLTSIAAISGLFGLAVTSGALIAQGALGTLLFVLSALAVLSAKPEFGGSVPIVLAVVLVLLITTMVRILVERRARQQATLIVGAAADSPETKRVRRSVARKEYWARILAIAAVSWGGAAAGVAWAEWDEVPFRLQDLEAAAGLLLGLVGAAIGGDAVWRFVQGAVRAGGSRIIIGSFVCAVALALNAASVYIPFVGLLVLIGGVILAIRLRRRSKQKYAGLRILS